VSWARTMVAITATRLANVRSAERLITAARGTERQFIAEPDDARLAQMQQRAGTRGNPGGRPCSLGEPVTGAAIVRQRRLRPQALSFAPGSRERKVEWGFHGPRLCAAPARCCRQRARRTQATRYDGTFTAMHKRLVADGVSLVLPRVVKVSAAKLAGLG